MCIRDRGAACSRFGWGLLWCVATDRATTHHNGRTGSDLRAGDEAHGVADRLEVLDLVVRDADAELLLGIDDDRHHRERVDVEVVGEGLVELHRGGVKTRLFIDDLGETFEDCLLGEGGHGVNSLLSRFLGIYVSNCLTRMARRDGGRFQGRTMTCAA